MAVSELLIVGCVGVVAIFIWWLAMKNEDDDYDDPDGSAWGV